MFKGGYMDPSIKSTDKKQSISLNLDLRFVVLGLLIIIAGMIYAWKPWESSASSNRTISVSGETTINAIPDEYIFGPSFKEEGTVQADVKTKLAKKTTTVIDELKKLGISEEKIKLNAYGYDDYYYYRNEDNGNYNASSTIEITVNNQELAQKVQDYLSTTDATGSLTPSAQFSQNKQNELETQARQEAIDDAKTKAQQSADLLSAKLGKVVTMTENNGFDVYPLYRDSVGIAEGAQPDAKSSMPVSPGQNEFTYTVSVTFEIK